MLTETEMDFSFSGMQQSGLSIEPGDAGCVTTLPLKARRNISRCQMNTMHALKGKAITSLLLIPALLILLAPQAPAEQRSAPPAFRSEFRYVILSNDVED